MSINSSKHTGKDNLTKPAPRSQLTRLKREEEEELWISGEELCTEGSSDEEDSKTCSRSSYKSNRNNNNSRNLLSNERHHWIEADNMEEFTEQLNTYSDIGNATMSSLTEIINSPKLNTPNTMQSNSSIETEVNFLMADDTSYSNMTKDEEGGESLKDSEISWKVYRDGHDNNGITYLKDNVNECELKNVNTINEKLKKEILKVENLDIAIQKFDNNVKKEIKETLLCQYKNRERLKEILKKVPLETGRLAENTQQFFSLYNEYIGVPALTDVQENINQNETHETEIS